GPALARYRQRHQPLAREPCPRLGREATLPCALARADRDDLRPDRREERAAPRELGLGPRLRRAELGDRARTYGALTLEPLLPADELRLPGCGSRLDLAILAGDLARGVEAIDEVAEARGAEHDLERRRPIRLVDRDESLLEPSLRDAEVLPGLREPDAVCAQLARRCGEPDARAVVGVDGAP